MKFTWKSVYETAKKHWFILGLLVVIGIAAAYPAIGRKGGYIHSEITVTYVAISLIFFISGLSLKTKALTEAILYWRLILLVQGFSLMFIPAFGYGLGKLLALTSFDPSLIHGIVVASCIPTTISSNVLMTKSAGGNEAASLTNAVLGSILGVFLSPILIFWLLQLGNSGNSISYADVFSNLAITVLGPLILGQLFRYYCTPLIVIAQKYVNFAIFNSFLLLLLVYQVFCDTFSSGSFKTVGVGSLFAVLAIVLVLFLSFSFLSFHISRIPFLNFTKEDTVAIMMCSATKSAALGIPLINVIFNGNTKIGIISLPLLMYHAEQLLAGSFLVPILASWTSKDKEDLTVQCNGSQEVLIYEEEAEEEVLPKVVVLSP